MALTELFTTNRATTNVASGGTTAPAQGTVETWTVTSSTGFGAAATGVSQFHVVDAAQPTELIAVTNVSGTTWTVTRGAESSTPVAHTSGFTVYQVVSAGWLNSVMTTQVSVAAFLAQAVPAVAHRGLPQVAPEDTIAAFQSAIAVMKAAGYVPALKLDASTLNDGTLGVMHDSTVTRTTTSTGNVSTYTAQTWQTLQCPAGTLVGPSWSTQPVPLLSDVLEQFGGQCVFVIEAKTGTSEVPAVLNLITTLGLQGSCVLTAEDTSLTQPGLAKAAGVGFWYYFNTNSVTSPVTPSQAAGTAGVTALGVAIDPLTGGQNYTDANVASVVSAAQGAGVPAFGFSYYRRSSYTRAAGLGITIHQCNDLYALTSTPSRTSDAFGLGAPVPGEIGSNGPAASGPYGMTTPPTSGYLGGAGNWRRQMNPAMANQAVYECLGFLAPAAGAASTWTLGATVFWDATETGSSDGGRFAGMVVACADDLVFNGNPTVNGYNCLIRQGGGSSFTNPTFQVFKQTRGAYQNNGTYASGTTAQVGSSNTNTTGYAAPNTLNTSYPAGTPVTSLTLASSVTIPSGMKIAMPSGQVATVSGPVSGSATVAISSLTPSSAWNSGSAVSFGIPVTIKVDCSVGGTTTITFKRTDTNDTLTVSDSSGPFAGGYAHIGKTGASSSAMIVSYASLSIS